MSVKQEEEDSCPICLEEYKDKSHMDNCMHTFCYECIMKWSKLNLKCPICKRYNWNIIHNVKTDSNYDIENVKEISDYHRIQHIENRWMIQANLEERLRAIGDQNSIMIADHLREIMLYGYDHIRPFDGEYDSDEEYEMSVIRTRLQRLHTINQSTQDRTTEGDTVVARRNKWRCTIL